MLAEQGLVFELLVWPSQLDQAASILRDIPGLVVVLEHTGLPYAAPSMADWSHALAGFFSAVPSARLKISALGLSDPTWKPRDHQSLDRRCARRPPVQTAVC
jgi:predicted TIM-barrel fold metal-dependent hydrolase